MENLDKKFNVGVDALAWHLYHWFENCDDYSLEQCLIFAEFMHNNYAPRQVDEEGKKRLYEAFMKIKLRRDKVYKVHKCTECGSIFTKAECSDCV